MASLEDLIGSIMRMAEGAEKRRQDQHDALGINKYWGGTTSNASRAYDDAQWTGKLKRIDELNRQKDTMTAGREGRENATELSRMRFGPGGAADREIQGKRDVAGMDLEGKKYFADQSLAGHQYSSDKSLEGTKYSSDKTFDMNAARDALQYRKQAPEEMLADRAARIAQAGVAAGTMTPDQARDFYDQFTAKPLDMSMFNPGNEQELQSEVATPAMKPLSVKKTLPELASTHSISGRAMSLLERGLPRPVPAERPGFISALKHSNEQLGGKLLDPFDLNKPKKSTNPLFPNYGY